MEINDFDIILLEYIGGSMQCNLLKQYVFLYMIQLHQEMPRQVPPEDVCVNSEQNIKAS